MKNSTLYVWRFGIRSLKQSHQQLYVQSVVAHSQEEAVASIGSGYECFFAGRRLASEGDLHHV